MNRLTCILIALGAAMAGCDDGTLPTAGEPSLVLTGADLRYEPSLDALVFELSVEGDAAAFTPDPAGQVDGAPVVGYVFPTTLSPAVVGFGDVAGTLMLAVTTHPDFDDTPLWDEDGDAAYDDDGVVYHSHWVVVAEDTRAPAGLAVVQSHAASVLPPTAPMPMYLDSPGFTVIEDGASLRVVVPASAVGRSLDFQAGVLTAEMRVDASGASPLLVVERVVSALEGGDATLTIRSSGEAAEHAWPAPGSDAEGSLDIEAAEVTYDAAHDQWLFSLDLAGLAAAEVPTPMGAVDGAPVSGYVFPTSIAPTAAGFGDTDGILALAVTSHPDFDDTPLWDEDGNAAYDDDGGVYHVHWAVLVEDSDSPAGLSVPGQADAAMLPPTAPMPMYLDSPGFHTFAADDRLYVVVPGWRLPGITAFSFDAVSARMRVDASASLPVLRVEEVVDVLSGDLSLPFDASH